MDLLDSNLIIYAAQPKYAKLREYIAKTAPFVSIVSKVETLGYHKLELKEQDILEDFFDAAVILQVSLAAVDQAIRLRQQRSMSLGDALIAGTAISENLRIATHNTGDFIWIEGLEVFDPLAE